MYSHGLYGALVITLWGIIMALTLGWLWLTAEAAAPVPAGDPYADEVAAFRRELHDWDRRG